MGSLLLEETPQGCVYLNRQVYEKFEEVRSEKSYDPNHLLEQLITLYCKQAGETKGLNVRLDLALRFCSLQALTPFESSNDLMTHLLAIHSSHEKDQECVTPKEETVEKTEQLKPKKNKRKPDHVQRKPYAISTAKNYVLNSEVELPVNRSRSPSASFSEDSGCFDTSKEEPKVVSDGVCQETSECRTELVGLDLSVVKKEKEETAGPAGKRPRKEKEHPDSLVHPSLHQGSVHRNQQTGYQQMWRSNSVPVGEFNPSISPKQPLSLQTSPQNYIPENIAQSSNPSFRKDVVFRTAISPVIVDDFEEENHFKTKVEENEAENYTYVLNSLDSPESPEGTEGVSPLPMRMPVKPPASNIPFSDKHSSSSDLSLTVPLKIIEDDEPQDLTSPQKSNQSKIISLGQSDGIHSQQGPVGKQSVFPNMPQRTLPQSPLMPALFKQPKDVRLIGEPQVTSVAMQNLARPPRIITLPVNQGNRPFLLPKNAQQNLIAMSSVLSPPGPPPKLIPASSVNNTGIPFQANLGAGTPTSNAANSPLLIPVGPTANENSETQTVPNGAIMVQFDLTSDETEAQRMRRKRKKMDDTSSFRDPPESSLPFNGPNKFRFYCDVCDTGFTRRYTYNRHRCKGKVEKHYCQLCDKAYLSKYKLKDHILVKHEGQTVACPDCGKRFSSRSSMEMHKKQQHEGQFSIFCKICGKGFNHTGHYYGHMNKHTNTKPFWCQKCGKRFYGSSYLHNHKQVCRGDDDWNHQCSICQRKFKCELYLKKHMKVHDTTPIYQQALDSNQNEVSFAIDADKSGLEDNDDSISADLEAGDVPADMSSPSKVVSLSNEFQKIDQAVA